ncbi:MAG: AsmA family protein [Gammaproteobacteria bacterium]|nr:AsmA family protein [Gammaproteobacteria bacterium]
MATATSILTRTLKWGSITLATLLLALVLLVIFLDWNWVKPYIERAVSEQTGREFAIDGDLDVDLWSWQPSLRAERIRFENAAWGNKPQMVQVGAFRTSVDLWRLVKGRVVIPELIIDWPVVRLAKSRRGTPNWELNPGAKPSAPAKQPQESPRLKQTTELPVIGRLVVTDGLVTYRDPATKANTRFTLANVNGSTGGQVTLDGNGRLDKQAWRLYARAGAFEKLASAQAPYPIDLGLDVGDARTKVKGSIVKPMELGGAKVDVSLQGPGLAMFAPFFGNAAPELPAYDVQGRVVSANGTWRLRDFKATVGNSDLSGKAAFRTGGERPLVTADLVTRRFDYGDFAGLAPPSKPEKKQKPTPLDLSALRDLDAIIKLRGDEIVSPAVALKDVRADVRLQDGRLRVEPIAVGIGGGRIRTQATLDARAQPFEANIRTDILRVDLATLREMANAGEALEGMVDGRFAISMTGASRAQMKQNAGTGALAAVDKLTVDDSQLAYDAPDSDTALRITADTTGSDGHRQIEIKGNGQYQGEPFKLDFHADPLLALADTQTEKPYAIDFKASGANTKLTATGTLRQPLALKAVDIKLSAQGDGTDRLAAALGKPLPDLPSYKVGGRVSREGARWLIDDFDGRVGMSDLQGDIALDTGGEKPFIRADFVSRKLDYADFTTMFGAESEDQKTAPDTEEPKPASERPAEPPFDLAPLQRFNADLSFKGKEIIAPNLQLQDIAIDIAVRDGRLEVEPFALGIGGGTIKGALNVDSATPIHGELTTTIDQVDVQKIAEALDLKSTFGVLDGHTEIAIVGSTEAQIAEAAEQTALTFIHSLVIEDTRFGYADPGNDMDIELAMRTTETSNGAEPIVIDGRGRYQGEAFSLNVGAGSLLRLLEEIRPYPVEARAEVAQTVARLKGDVTRPLDMKGLDLNLSTKGPNPSRLEKLAGLPLPDLPPYEIKGELFRDEGAWRVQGFKGTVGDSDLAGDIEVQTLRDPRPLIVADLVSRRLDLDDLGGLIGAAPDTGKGEAESGKQEVEANIESKSKTVLPRDPIDLSALSAIDADVTFNGKRVETGLPIDDLRIQAKLDDGRLALLPLDFGVGGGTVKSRLRLDGSARPVEAAMKTEISRVNLKELLHGSGFAQKSVGNIGGRADLRAAGDSIADLMATLDGQLSLIMSGGQFDSLLVELGGLDAAQAIGDLLGDVEAVPIRCAFTDLQARDGQVNFESFTIDTVDTLFSGDGDIDLDEERIKFVVAPHPKDFSLFSFRTPLHMAGRFSDLAFYGEYAELAGQAAAAVALGLVATPFAAIIPFIDSGDGENSACKGLLDDAKNELRAAESERRRNKEEPPPAVSFIRGDASR